METTTNTTLVRPEVGELVHVSHGRHHRLGGKVVAVEPGSFDVLKYTEWDDDAGTEIDYADDDPAALSTLYDVEQIDATCIVTVLR